MIDQACLKWGVTLLDAPNLVALLHYQLLQGAAVLPGDTNDQSGFERNEGTGVKEVVGTRWCSERLMMGLKASLLGSLVVVRALAVRNQPHA